MQGPLAQIVALTCWGNAILHPEAGVDAGDFARSNIAFGFCESVRFVSLNGQAPDWEPAEYARDPAEWLHRLGQEGVTRLRLLHASADSEEVGGQPVAERMLVGFVGGGGRWLIEAVKTAGSDFWEGRWELGDRSRADQRIWRVSYGRIAVDATSTEPAGDETREITQELTACLTAIAAFARAQHYDNFATAFDAGLSALTGAAAPPPDLRVELIPPGPAHAASRRLLAAVQAAWVFGGMGSWNDIGFAGDDQRRYEELSEQLYQLLNRATLAAANGIDDRSEG